MITAESDFESGYDVQIDATALNEFVTLASTLAFSWIANEAKRPFSEQFNNPNRLYEHFGLERVLQ